MDQSLSGEHENRCNIFAQELHLEAKHATIGYEDPLFHTPHDVFHGFLQRLHDPHMRNFLKEITQSQKVLPPLHQLPSPPQIEHARGEREFLPFPEWKYYGEP